MNNALPKQFMPLHGKPILMHAMERFSSSLTDCSIIVVLAKEHQEEWKALCGQHRFILSHVIAEGGETRYASVKNGLALVPDGCVVGIHDAARPLVSSTTILNTYKTAEDMGNACPAIPLTDSIRVIKGKENCAVDRTTYSIIQTPQCFHSHLIKQAFLKAYRPEFTDDATVLEAYGEKINLIEGNKENIKITTPQDLIIAEALFNF